MSAGSGGYPQDCGAGCRHGIPPAAFPDVWPTPLPPRLTTPYRGRAADPLHTTTSNASAANTIGSRPTASGKLTNPNPVCWNGSLPPAERIGLKRTSRPPVFCLAGLFRTRNPARSLILTRAKVSQRHRRSRSAARHLLEGSRMPGPHMRGDYTKYELSRASVMSMCPEAWPMASEGFDSMTAACGVTPQAQNTGT